MKLIDRYILKESGVPFFLTLSFLMMILVTGQMLSLGDLFINKNVSLGTLGKLLLFLLPPFLSLAVPLSVLIATIITVSRLTADNEITAFQAAGISLARVAIPVIGVAFFSFLLTLFLSVKGNPLLGTSMKKAALGLLQQEESLGIEPGFFHELIDGIMIYVEESPGPGVFKGVVINDVRNPQKPYLILAESGEVLSRPGEGFIGFRLQNGSQHISHEKISRYQWIQFSRYQFKIKSPSAFPTLSGEEREESVLLLKDMESRGELTDPRERDRLTDHYQTYAFPFSCLIFGFIGIPLGLMIKKGGKMGGFSAGLGVAVFYYMTAIFGRFFSASGWVSPLLAAWFPNLIMAGIAGPLYLLFKAGFFRKRSFFSGR